MPTQSKSDNLRWPSWATIPWVSHKHTSVITLTLLLCICFATLRILLPKRRLPPGPPGLPLLGNIFNMPSIYSWTSIAKLGKAAYMNVLGIDILYINSAKIAVDLLDKRGAIYSDRPHLVFGGEL